MSDARVVHERQDAFDMQSGPYGYERVGFCINGRVFWVGCVGSGLPGGGYEADSELARQIVERWLLAEKLADVYTVDTDQVGLIGLVDVAKRLVK